MPRRLASNRRASALPLALVIAAASFATGSPAPASDVADQGRLLSLRASAREADLVLTGALSGLESRWAGKKIVTAANVSVERTVKGGADSSVRVTVMGGHVEHPVPMTMIVADAPSLADGEEALFFLRDSGDGTYAVTAKLPLDKDPSTGRKRVLLGNRPIPVDSLENLRRAFEERDAQKRTRQPERRR